MVPVGVHKAGCNPRMARLHRRLCCGYAPCRCAAASPDAVVLFIGQLRWRRRKRTAHVHFRILTVEHYILQCRRVATADEHYIVRHCYQCCFDEPSISVINVCVRALVEFYTMHRHDSTLRYQWHKRVHARRLVSNGKRRFYTEWVRLRQRLACLGHANDADLFLRQRFVLHWARANVDAGFFS